MSSPSTTVAPTPVGAGSELSTLTLVSPVVGADVGKALVVAITAFRVLTPGITLRVSQLASYGYVVSVTEGTPGRSNRTLSTGWPPPHQPSRGSGWPSARTSART